jgi:signal transduction histidine kinase/Flp pilus assembly protein TadD
MPDDTGKVNTLISAENETENIDAMKALSYGREALEISRRLHYIKGVTQSLNCIGRAYKASGDFDSSLYYFRKSLAAGISDKDTHAIASELGNIGTVFRNRGNYDSATVYYHYALDIAEKSNDLNIIGNCLNNLGNVLKDQDNLEEAIQYYSRALEIRIQQKNKRGIGNANLNLGVCYGLLNDYSTSEKYFREALVIFSSMNDKAGMAKCNNNIAQSLMSQNKSTDAIPFLNKALQLQKEMGDKNGIAFTLCSIARLNKNIKNYDEAMKLSKQSLQLALEMGSKELEMKNYDLLQEISFQQNNYKQAYTYLDEATSLKDSLFNENKARIINELQTKYGTEKKEQEIVILNQENKTRSLQRNIFFIGSVALLLILFASIYIFFQQRHISRQKILIQDRKISELLQEQTINTYNAMIVGQEEERKRIAIDLHDRLGSMLSTVKVYFSALKSKNKPDDSESLQLQEKATSLLDLTFDELRKIANDLSTGMITDLGLRPAIEDLSETISRGGNIKCNVLFHNLTERIDNQTEIGIYRITQELLSNILKHAQAKNITIQLNKIDESLQVTVEDDGIGYNYGEKIKSPGMGLKNILLRVEKLGGKFHVDSMPEKGSFSFLEIPIRTEALDSIHQI